MAQVVLTLDQMGVARLHQALAGLLPIDELPVADVYLDAEGTTIARRIGDAVVVSVPGTWPAPTEVRTARPVVVAASERLPAEPIRPDDAVLLLPTGGTRADDARAAAWARAWRSAASVVVEVPLSPAEALHRTGELAAAYSSGRLVDVATTPQPTGEGRTLFFTGLSGSGKSTIARAVVERLASSRTVTLLDGDVVRTHLSRGLGFSREDRDLNIRRIGWVAAEVTKHGGVAVCAPIAPYDATRKWVRAEVEAAGGPGAFLLVWVSTPIEVCEARDVKGLYAKARRGELPGFTGIDDPYESPLDADVIVDTSTTAVEAAVDEVMSALSKSSRNGGSSSAMS